MPEQSTGPVDEAIAFFRAEDYDQETVLTHALGNGRRLATEVEQLREELAEESAERRLITEERDRALRSETEAMGTVKEARRDLRLVMASVRTIRGALDTAESACRLVDDVAAQYEPPF